MRFRDRTEAGRRLAERLIGFANTDAVVFALPRGGVPVGAEVARQLRLPLDVILVRKLGVPAHAEWGMGAVGEDGAQVVNDSVVRSAGVTADQIASAVSRERRILEARRDTVREAVAPLRVKGRTAIVVDDGLATGGTARAACAVLRARGAASVVMAVPVAPPGWEETVGGDADRFVALSTPGHFMGVGEFYEDFSPVSDESMIGLLVGLREEVPDTDAAHDVRITTGDGSVLEGILRIPPGATTTVVFAHGSGSSRNSPRNRAVAEHMTRVGLATLLVDLLTLEEESQRRAVFDIGLLARRLASAVGWVRTDERTCATSVALFGASTGAAAALRVASMDREIAAVVCRGGRTDLADDVADSVHCPVLMLAGSRDVDIVRMNEATCRTLGARCRVEVVPGATHLFEEPGTLDHVAAAASTFCATVVAAPDQSVGFQE